MMKCRPDRYRQAFDFYVTINIKGGTAAVIEIYQLEQLLAFHKYGTLSSAAEHLDVTEPSLSRTMRKLEEELGVHLFERRKNRIVLNQAGVLAVDHAKQILSKVEEMELHIHAFDRSLNTLNIGSCALGALMELRPMVAGLYPTLDIASSVAREELLLRGLQKGEYNLIILPHPLGQQDLFCQQYRTERIYLSVSRNHPMAARRLVSLSELDGQSFIVYRHEDLWTDMIRDKLPNSRFFFQEDLDAIVSIALNSDIPTFSSDILLENMESYRTERVNIPISGLENELTYYLVCKSAELPKWGLFLKKLRQHE